LVRGQGEWIASNDECPDAAAGTHGSCITHRPPGGLWPLDPYYVIVHAHDSSTATTGTIAVTGSDGTNLRFSGRTFAGVSFKRPTYDVGWTTGDEVVSVSPLNGPDRAVCLVLDYPGGTADRNGVRLRASDWRGRWMGGCHLRPGSKSQREGNWLLVGVGEMSAPGPVTVYVNDRAADVDGDTLGNDLENQVGTCNGRADDTSCFSPFPVPNGIDTDGDGLRDDWELLGHRSAGLPLPRWGANPLHKDAFIEVDRYVSASRLTAADAETIAAIYALGSATDLRNPDGRNGVALHFDIGISGCTPSGCSTAYGDFGGHSTVPDGIWYTVAWADPAYFSNKRRGVFTWAVADRGCGGGQYAGGTHAVGFGADCPGGDTVDALAHEWGHLIGLEHGGGGAAQGAYNCKPNYESFMNYAFGGARKLSLGTRPRLNPTDLVEADGVGPDPSYMTAIWDIVFDGNALDWNRDDTADTSDARSYGYPMWAPGKSCGPGLELRSHDITWANAYPDKSPSVVSFDGKVWILYWHNDSDDLAYVRFTPHSHLGSNLRLCGPPDNPSRECGTLDRPPTVLPDSLSSSPMFVHCPYCPRADGLGSSRIVGVYARGRDALARYYVANIDRTGGRRMFEMAGARPATFANVPPYVDPSETAVADPAVAYHPERVGGEFPIEVARIFVLYRHTDGTLHQVVLDYDLEVRLADCQVLVGGLAVTAHTEIGRDPALVSYQGGLRGYYANPWGWLREIRWVSGCNWIEDVPGPFASRPIWAMNQPGVVPAGTEVPPAIRLEYRTWGSATFPFPLRRTWTNPGRVFSFDSPVRNSWDADYRGATRLTLFNGVEVAAVAGIYPSALVAAHPHNDPDRVCALCDCHLGTRPDATGGRTACGHADGTRTADLDACNCPWARSLLFRPLADGVVNVTLEDVNDWLLIGSGMCSILRPCEDCVPPGFSCFRRYPESCVLPPQERPN
ncbi:MAG: hypothetical protein QME96_06340, partial [Myxococcota bacterium]|nr:hypothetical protein [Myxococcota bacterium]